MKYSNIRNSYYVLTDKLFPGRVKGRYKVILYINKHEDRLVLRRHVKRNALKKGKPLTMVMKAIEKSVGEHGNSATTVQKRGIMP
jgi:hypothetical protein